MNYDSEKYVMEYLLPAFMTIAVLLLALFLAGLVAQIYTHGLTSLFH